MTIEKDVTKKVAEDNNSQLADLVAVKFEHCKVVETLDLQPELLVSEKQLGKLVKDYNTRSSANLPLRRAMVLILIIVSQP